MKSLLTTILTFYFSMTFSQDVKTTYFKDFPNTKETTEKKAKYQRNETIDILGADTFLKVEIIGLDKNCNVSVEYYKNGLPTKQWTTFDYQCKPQYERNFDELVYDKVELDSLYENPLMGDAKEGFTNAMYDGSQEGLFKFLAKEIKYPTDAINYDIKGTVYLNIFIDKEGNVRPISIEKGSHPFLDYASWETIQRMHKWTPAKKGNKPIDSYIMIVFNYSLK